MKLKVQKKGQKQTPKNIKNKNSPDQKKSTHRIFKSRKFQFRQNLITKEWVKVNINANSIPNKFEEFLEPNISKKECLTCKIETQKKLNSKEVLMYGNKQNWSLKVLEPSQTARTNPRTNSPFKEQPDTSIENLIKLNTLKNIADLPDLALAEIFDSVQERYLQLIKNKSVKYINFSSSPSFNYKQHSHNLIQALPFIPQKIDSLIKGAYNYHRQNSKCVHCVMLDFEKNSDKRIIEENKEYMAFHPYIPDSELEIKIYPKEHKPYYEKTNNKEILSLAKTLRNCLYKLQKINKNITPIITLYASPCNGLNYSFNHWHLTVTPLLDGFNCPEQTTKTIFINPNEAAELLNGKK